MTKMRRAMGPFALVACLAVGCGGGGSSKPLTEDDFCQQKAEKECQVTGRCGTVAANCIAQRKPLCTAIVASSKTAPRIFHPENVAACVNKTNAVYAQLSIKPADLADLDDTCGYVFQGNSTAACTVKFDCSDKSKICDKGICSAKVTKNAGAFCTDPGAVCATGSYCAVDPATTVLTCLPKAQQTESCVSVPCKEDLRCDAVTHTCMPRQMSGETCTDNNDCVAATSFCDPYIGNKCDVGLSFAGGAAACGAFGGGVTGTGGSGGGGTGGASGGTDAGSDVAAAG